MVDIFFGVPRSGKSYGAVYRIASAFSKEDIIKDKKYKLSSYTDEKGNKLHYKACLTNINELKLEKFDKRVKPLNFDDFFEKIVELHKLYKEGKTDSELIPIAEKYDLYTSLIVIDEAQNYLDKEKVALVWWLSYHGHFNQDVVLITQDFALMNTKYKSFSEFFYGTVPNSRKIFTNQMIYYQYTSKRLGKKNTAGKLKYPINKKVFELYKSGGKQKSEQVALKFFGVAIGAIAIVYYILNYTSVSGKDIEHTETTKQQSPAVDTKKLPSQKKDNQLDKNERLVIILTNGDFYIYNNTYYPRHFFQILKKQDELKLLSSEKFNDIYSLQYYTTEKAVKKESTNEKNPYSFLF